MAASAPDCRHAPARRVEGYQPEAGHEKPPGPCRPLVSKLPLGNARAEALFRWRVAPRVAIEIQLQPSEVTARWHSAFCRSLTPLVEPNRRPLTAQAPRKNAVRNRVIVTVVPDAAFFFESQTPTTNRWRECASRRPPAESPSSEVWAGCVLRFGSSGRRMQRSSGADKVAGKWAGGVRPGAG
jgi:hypothetical protein